MMARTRMQRWFPSTSYPLVVSAPMDFVTNPRLATEVTKAGGLGFIQGGRDFTPGSPALEKLDDQLRLARELLLGPESSSTSTNTSTATLPIGVGFVTYAASMQHFGTTAAPILRRHRPAAVWFFAPSPTPSSPLLADAIRSLRPSSPSSSSPAAAAEEEEEEEDDPEEPWDPKIAVQVGSAAAAREAALLLGADIVVAQGADAGGHQFARAAGVVSLVPEVVDVLRGDEEQEGEEGGGRGRGEREIAVWAAGGIADGRGVAAAMALGAEGAVLGTRYIVAAESDAQDFKKKAVLSTADGGQNTVKSQLHDHVQGNRDWPAVYDGRAIVHPSYRDHLAGVPLEANARSFQAAKESGDTSRMVTWSGTGVGLVKKEQPAADITREVRDGALRVLSSLRVG